MHDVYRSCTTLQLSSSVVASAVNFMLTEENYRNIVQGVAQQLRKRDATHGFIVLELVGGAPGLEGLLQRHRVSHETRARHDALVAHLVDLLVVAGQDAVPGRHPGVRRAHDVVLARDREHRAAVVIL